MTGGAMAAPISDRSLTWEFDDVSFQLLPLGHEELEELYKTRRLPMASPLFVKIDELDIETRRDAISDAMEQTMDAFTAMLSMGLLKGQPGLEWREIAVAIARRCDVGSGEVANRFLREVIALGNLSLHGLDSPHRLRLAGLVATAAAMLSDEDPR
jgi:hypothetical protein